MITQLEDELTNHTSILRTLRQKQNVTSKKQKAVPFDNSHVSKSTQRRMRILERSGRTLSTALNEGKE